MRQIDVLINILSRLDMIIKILLETRGFTDVYDKKGNKIYDVLTDIKEKTEKIKKRLEND